MPENDKINEDAGEGDQPGENEGGNEGGEDGELPQDSAKAISNLRLQDVVRMLWKTVTKQKVALPKRNDKTWKMIEAWPKDCILNGPNIAIITSGNMRCK